MSEKKEVPVQARIWVTQEVHRGFKVEAAKRGLAIAELMTAVLDKLQKGKKLNV